MYTLKELTAIKNIVKYAANTGLSEADEPLLTKINDKTENLIDIYTKVDEAKDVAVATVKEVIEKASEKVKEFTSKKKCDGNKGCSSRKD